ncbi:chitin deacetylase 7-like [Dermatophagoides pteronyssinus]|uniref:chitin deacetylase 7-like n=1 Tax=Dermatophagoides pteronyssinus TaxID=6956 RepID=UPI003F661326
MKLFTLATLIVIISVLAGSTECATSTYTEITKFTTTGTTTTTETTTPTTWTKTSTTTSTTKGETHRTGSDTVSLAITATGKPYHSNFKNVDCNFTACLAPECQCLQDLPPNGMNPDDIPQFVIVTFDGAVTVTNFPYYQTLFDFKNPNNCPIQSTYFVSHVDSNYKLVHELYRRGNEIGVHSISKARNNNQEYWKKLDYEGWRQEMGGQRKILSKYSEIPIDRIRGVRAPNLQTAGNVTFTAFVDEKFEYDCSNPSRQGIRSPFFPYTFDYGFQRENDCQVQPCLKEGENYPGFWDVPMNDWDVEYEVQGVKVHRECAMASGCIMFEKNGEVNYHPTADQIYDLFEYNFDRFYNGNRAPFPLFLSEEWIHDEAKRDALLRFIQNKLNKHDIFFVSIDEVLQWMQSPTNVADYIEKTKQCPPILQTKCGLKDGEKIDDISQFKRKCDYEKIDELNGQSKRMVICDDLHCPVHYPWVNRLE